MPRSPADARIPGVSAVVHDAAGRLLLVRRVNPPGAGTWALPGGHVEPGEDTGAAAVREVAEETGLRVRPGRQVGVAEHDAPSGGVFVISAVRCDLEGGVLRPGDDAADARWFTPDEVRDAELVPGLAETLVRWHVLPG